MYKKIFLLCVAALCICNISFAKIWRVNNTAGITADFTTAQAAHDGAAVGDTIHLEPSLTNYGDVTTTKRLSWISTGYFLESHPGLQYATTPGTMGQVTINAGSENSVFSCNTTINGYFYCTASNVSFIRCYTGYLYLYNGANNCVVTDCYISTILTVQSSINEIINNNILAFSISVDNISSANIANNVIGAGQGGSLNIYNSQFQNNILNVPSSVFFMNSNINNNITSDASLPAGNGNQNNVNMSTVFLNYQGTTDGDFVLKAGSPAIGAGFGGVDAGAFGGTSPFVLGLQPAVPAIYQLNAPGAPSGNTMNVSFSTKSNN